MALDSLFGRATLVVVTACTVLTACASIGAKRQPALTAETSMQVATEAEASGNTELALSMYAQAATREPGNTELHLRYVDALIRAGKISQARQLLTERLSASPRSPDLLRGLALIDLV